MTIHFYTYIWKNIHNRRIDLGHNHILMYVCMYVHNIINNLPKKQYWFCCCAYMLNINSPAISTVVWISLYNRYNIYGITCAHTYICVYILDCNQTPTITTLIISCWVFPSWWGRSVLLSSLHTYLYTCRIWWAETSAWKSYWRKQRKTAAISIFSWLLWAWGTYKSMSHV